MLNKTRLSFVLHSLSEPEKSAVSAISDLFLDTEHDEQDYDYIVKRLIETGIEWDLLDKLYRNDVAFLLSFNLNSVAGEWAGFNNEWLFEQINEIRKKRRNSLIIRFIDSALIPFRASTAKKNWDTIRTKYYNLVK